MGFLDHFRTSELAKARKEAERNPSPVTIEAHCRALLAGSDLDAALEQATKGLERFPDSDRLIGVVKTVKKSKQGPRVAELKEKVRTSPSPILYRQLAEVYRDIGDDQRALDTCIEVRERYPKDENTFLVMGEIFHERFQASYLGSDGKQAVENLQRACELNRNNYNALVKLSHLYVNLGLFKKAVPHLRSIINFAPADRKAKGLLGKAMELSAKESDIDDIDTLFRLVEERQSPFWRVVSSSDGGAEIQMVRGAKATIKDASGVLREIDAFNFGSEFEGVIAFDRELKTLGAKFKNTKVDKRATVEAVRAMVDILIKHAPHLAMGSFRKGVLETPDVGIWVVTWAEGYLYLLTAPDARADQIEQRVGDLIGRFSK